MIFIRSRFWGQTQLQGAQMLQGASNKYVYKTEKETTPKGQGIKAKIMWWNRMVTKH